ncbi:uncharacterized protein [Lolium perenne]|uniref:uncharacterized protein n=1 Tax=Lolium perenne TaxID=4522 RepID=UPI003A9A4C31
MADISASVVSEAVGARFASNFIFKPAAGTRGGILIACSDDFAVVLDPLASCDFFITGTITDRSNGSSWSMTAVYGPQEDSDKIIFLQELRRIKTMVLPEWIILGDFNLIKSVDEKSNSNINIRMMGRFRRTIDELELKEIHLNGRRFTWSNERENTVHCKLDRVLITQAWELSHLQYQLVPASTSISDHCPMILKKMQIKHYSGFRFEACWASCHGFLDIVKKSWTKPVSSNDAVRKLHTKLSRTAAGLKKWYKNLQKETRLQEDIANEVIFQLDLAQEERELSADERLLRRFLKARLLGIAAVERSRWKQRARLSWIKAGDANTRFFHLKANGRRRKNHIPALKSDIGIEVTDHEAKANILHQHFAKLLGTTGHRHVGLNWAALNIIPANLAHLEVPFTIEELKSAIFGLYSEKAPGPDGFTGLFYKKCWEIIHLDLLKAPYAQLFKDLWEAYGHQISA